MRRQHPGKGGLLLGFLCMSVLLGTVVAVLLFAEGKPPAGTSPYSAVERIRL